MIIAGLLGGIGAGITGAVLAVGAGYGFLGAILAYSLAGMIGMSLAAIAVALCPNRREDYANPWEAAGSHGNLPRDHA